MNIEKLKRWVLRLFSCPIYRLAESYKGCLVEECVSSFAHYDSTAKFTVSAIVTCPSKMYMYENTNINDGAIFIISPVSKNGKFVMKRNSGAAVNLTVITGNHQRKVGSFFKELSKSHVGDIDEDVIVEEDVWIGANVTLLPGVVIGRGATIGAGSVCLKSVPPYAIVLGNPAKVVGFNYIPEQIIEHEKVLYPETERIPLETLEKNYKKYFLDRVSEIKSFTKI